MLRTVVIILTIFVIFVLVYEKQNPHLGSAADKQVLKEPQIGLPDPPAFITNPPAWFLLLFNITLVFLILGVVGLLHKLLRPKPDTQTLLVQEAQSALADLEAGGDLQNTVMRCYARMSKVLAQSRDIERDKAMTPREFEIHLAEIGLRDEHIRRLTRLFEGVRYGARPSDRLAEHEALACLKAIVQAYEETP